MLEETDVFLDKVELIMESPTERNKYKDLKTIDDKLSFLRNHFIMNELAIRLLERKYLLQADDRESLMAQIDALIKRHES